MPTAIEALDSLETQIIDQGAIEANKVFVETWRDPGNSHRNRLLSVLNHLNDIPCADVKIWTDRGEVGIVFGETRFVWISYTGPSWHMWTNFGCDEEGISDAGMYNFNDEDEETSENVVQIVKNYLLSKTS